MTTPLTVLDSLVTVVTATWGRPRTLLDRCVPSVRGQDYAGLVEHLIVTDGHDEDLAGLLRARGYSEDSRNLLRFVQLGRNWSAPEMVHGGVGVVPRLVGAFMARGKYVTYLDDDNAYLPHHVSALAGALEASDADFAVSRWHDGPGGPVAGWSPPGRGRTDTSSIMHRGGTLRFGTWDHRVGYENDGALVEGWIAAGAKWAFVDQPTFTLYPHRRGAPDPQPAEAIR